MMNKSYNIFVRLTNNLVIISGMHNAETGEGLVSGQKQGLMMKMISKSKNNYRDWTHAPEDLA